MQGKVCLVTGANSGVGKETALGLAEMGATVVMVCRDRTKGEAALNEIKAKSGNEAVELLVADLSSQQSIQELAEQFKQHYKQLHVLINNAGIFLLSRRETVDRLEMTLAVNYLAPFLLTDLLLDVLKASAPARIINVSSAAQEGSSLHLDDLQSKQRYKAMGVYGQSKLALVMFTYELARRLEGTGVTANCLHPGFVATNIAQNDLVPPLRILVKLIVSRFGISAHEGAKTSLYLASSPDVEGVTGKYFVRSVPKRTTALSYDTSLQEKLWESSEKLVKSSVMV